MFICMCVLIFMNNCLFSMRSSGMHIKGSIYPMVLTVRHAMGQTLRGADSFLPYYYLWAPYLYSLLIFIRLSHSHFISTVNHRASDWTPVLIFSINRGFIIDQYWNDLSNNQNIPNVVLRRVWIWYRQIVFIITYLHWYLKNVR